MAPHHPRLNASLSAIGLAAFLCAGCGGMPSMPTFSGGVFGSEPKPAQNGWTPAVTEQTMMAAAQSGAPNPAGAGEEGGACPRFSAPAKEKVVTIYESGRLNEAAAVMHRAEITQTARECEAGSGRISVKYGVGGRVLLGPKGRPGAITLPLTVTVTDKARKTVKSEIVKVQVEIGAEQPASFFSIVRVIDFPADAPPQDYAVSAALAPAAPAAPVKTPRF